MIRAAKASDAPALGKVLSDWIDTTPWMRRIHSREEDRQHLGQLIREMSVRVLCRKRLFRAAEPVGFLARRAHFVHALYLAPEARGKGHGRALLAEAKASEAKLELWCFQANHAARAFYQAEGFTPVEFGDGSGNDEGLPDLRLIWVRE